TQRAVRVSPSENPARAAGARLAQTAPGAHQVVSCYLKLEPRDKTRGKYLIKMKNRVKQVAAELERRPLDRGQREAVAADLARVQRYFEEPTRLPPARGVAVLAAAASDPVGVLAVAPVH